MYLWRHREVDDYATSADTAVYDAFGVLDADVDGQNGGAYTSTDSVGYLGQSGHSSEEAEQSALSLRAGGTQSAGV